METFINKVRELSAGKAVVLPAFGDAESMATAYVAVKALGGDKVSAVHIDHGMLRRGEAKAVRASLSKIGVGNIISVSLDKFFLISSVKTDDGRVIGPLSTVCDPDEKRVLVSTAIEREYKRIVDERFGDSVFRLGVHSVGGASIGIDNCAAKIAKEAGADEFLICQPFPLQALSIRMLCNDSAIAVTTEQRTALDNTVSVYGGQFKAKLIPFRSVGVRDGVRSYRSMAVLSGGGTDKAFYIASQISANIDKKLPFINRVLFRADSDEKATTFHGGPMHISKDTLDALRTADAIVAEEFACTKAAQFFAVLLPFVADKSKRYSVGIRAVDTADYTTATALVPGVDFDINILKKTAARIKDALETVDMVLYDVTSKPPAAIEFE